ncbi:autotransporter outer membrane beta-barrel domain-containing protein [Pseudomonas citronellolis]|uniref:autotransporter outer membrane beta-barrel domain-containing protein n=1 Tax=Pseudomonas citronellolis TaxID=53408 RepID=UPI0023E358B5|nr:autotransporter outer membrane beta-barrel domain-containing protein [Pseudomonas citronellolis]MDF3934329.1 autotransporter outer membrane beta-barrel domain-containing protein [Pseudomonas citronellolis]
MKSSAPLFSRLRRSHLAHLVGLAVASLFSFGMIEVEAEDSVVEAERDDLDEPSAAGALLEPSPPSYLEVARQAVEDAPRVFASRALLGAPAPITPSAGGVGIGSSATVNGQVINLAAAGTTGLQAGAGVSIGFEQGGVFSTAVNANLAKNQVGIRVEGGQVEVASSSIVLEPKTAAGAAFTANDMTAAIVQAGGSLKLTDTTVSVGGLAKGNNNRGVVVSDAGSSLDMSGGSIGTSSWGAVGLAVEKGGQADLSGASVSTSGARSATTGGSHAVHVSGEGSRLDAENVALNTSGGSAYGLRVDDGAQATLNDSSVSTGGGNGHAVLADDASVGIEGGSLVTTGKGSVGVWARNGASVTLAGSEVRTSGAAVSSAAPVDGEKTLSLSHGLLAGGTGTRIQASDVSLLIAAGSASAARAEEGASILLDGGNVEVSGAATTTSTTAALHALSGGSIDGADLSIHASASLVGGLRAEGAGSSVSLRDSDVQVDGAGNVANASAGARAMAGGSLSLDNVELVTHGLYGHGISLEGAGSQATINDTRVAVDGARSIGLSLTPGAAATVTGSSFRVDAQPNGAGPWAPGVQVDGATLAMRDSHVYTTPGSSLGVRVLNGSEVRIDNGSVTTEGNYSAAVSAANSTLAIDQLTVTTHGNDNAMGIVADAGAQVSVTGGSVLTTGNGSPVASNLTFPHALVARNPGAQLSVDGTSVLTTGTQAYGAAVDDGGSMLLKNLSVETRGQYSTGIYAGIGTLKPGSVSLTGENISVKTLGDDASAALVSRQYQADTAVLELDGASLATQGARSHGVRAESGAQLIARNATVTTAGPGALGALASNSASASLDAVAIVTSGEGGHGVVAKNAGSVSARDLVVSASGAQSAALYAQGSEALPGGIEVERGVLANRDGATLAVAGVADIALRQSLAGGSGQWLNVDSASASAGTQLSDMGTGQWQGVGQTMAAAGQARIELDGSIVSGSARTATGSTADLDMHDSSLWKLTGDSNLTGLRNDASVIDFSAPLGGQFKTLSVNQYQGANGTLALNTYLYDDGSPSDQLVIDGGNASGASNLLIRNAGGPGALTRGNGIQVVDAVNGGTTEAGAFRLLGRVVAGPYEYSLHRASLDDSNAEAWYLRSTQDAQPVDPVDPVTPADPNGPVDPLAPDPRTPDPLPPQKPNYRPETSLYSALPAMALHYSRALVDTLHERVGEERRLATEPLLAEASDSYGPSLGWGRLIYRKGSDSLANGADYDYRIQAFQVGADLYRHEDTDGSTDQAGVSLQAGRISGSVEHTDGRGAGDDSLRSYGIGAYWTHFGPEGWYLDGVLQYNRFDLKASPREADALNASGHGITASLEAGYPFKVNKDETLHVEPQAQLIVSKVKLADSHDDAAKVRFEDVDSLTGRLGVRVDKDWLRTDDKGEVRRTNAWVRPSVWHEFKGQAKTAFSSADGYIPFGTDMRGTWGEVNVGVDYQLGERTTLTGSLGYQKAFGGDARSYEGIIGIKIDF